MGSTFRTRCSLCSFIKLAAEFIKTGTPTDPKTGLPLYLVTCCFEGPHIKGEAAFKAGKIGEDWMHNPAMVYANHICYAVFYSETFTS